MQFFQKSKCHLVYVSHGWERISVRSPSTLAEIHRNLLGWIVLHVGECREEGGRMWNKCAAVKKRMKRWKYRRVWVNLGHCYRTGERTPSTGFQLGSSLASCWYQWQLHQGGGGEGGIDFFRRMCVKVKCNNACNELKFWLALISETC